MKLLIAAATGMEIAPLQKHLHAFPMKNVDVLITGIGMTATAYALTKRLQSTGYDFVLQVGIGGSFDRNIALGSVVFVSSDQHGDLGAEDHERFLDVFEMGLLDRNLPPFSAEKLITPVHSIHYKIKLPAVNGLTINTVSGSEATIKQRWEKYGCAVESMEGAAFHYVCLQEAVPFAQVRAISNYVTPRDKSQWKMGLAITNLNNWLVEFLGVV